jgi:hypothetical protein
MSTVPPYIDALIAHAKTIAKPGQVAEVTIYHDPWCPRLRGGSCQCEPEIELLNRQQRRAQKRKEKTHG